MVVRSSALFICASDRGIGTKHALANAEETVARVRDAVLRQNLVRVAWRNPLARLLG
jgi:hypothetical protein